LASLCSQVRLVGHSFTRRPVVGRDLPGSDGARLFSSLLATTTDDGPVISDVGKDRLLSDGNQVGSGLAAQTALSQTGDWQLVPSNVAVPGRLQLNPLLRILVGHDADAMPQATPLRPNSGAVAPASEKSDGRQHQTWGRTPRRAVTHR